MARYAFQTRGDGQALRLGICNGRFNLGSYFDVYTLFRAKGKDIKSVKLVSLSEPETMFSMPLEMADEVYFEFPFPLIPTCAQYSLIKLVFDAEEVDSVHARGYNFIFQHPGEIQKSTHVFCTGDVEYSGMRLYFGGAKIKKEHNSMLLKE
ncbi:hypothetical protein GMAR_ORF31 [Golden Marseillevirus]|uniref:hypothetical protein n=1 Tax=Golden Marseillevirus TaxID=1720526 RepID=UPI000877AC3D|nr:hypothetical protein GMAR_ORF31 [Golden Marseillevirus]ALX27406.1 hypothetical protein GMAR_ORF31 [Golden Marseillevirus]